MNGPVHTHRWIDGELLLNGCMLCADAARAAAPPDWTVLANDIRLVDGNHDLGAGELAARLTERGWRRAAAPPVEPDKDETISRLSWALRVATHKPHDQDGEPDPDSGFPVCSVCGAIQTVPPSPDRVAGLRERLLHALRTNAYRGSWHSDHQMMMPMAWDADDVVDRVIEDAALLDEPVPLDEERLAMALPAVFRKMIPSVTPDPSYDRSIDRTWAEVIAAEYARLTDPKGADHE